MLDLAWLDPARFDDPGALVRREPFPFMVAHGLLPTQRAPNSTAISQNTKAPVSSPTTKKNAVPPSAGW
jgi:hypothetical protein